MLMLGSLKGFNLSMQTPFLLTESMAVWLRKFVSQQYWLITEWKTPFLFKTKLEEPDLAQERGFEGSRLSYTSCASVSNIGNSAARNIEINIPDWTRAPN